MSAQRTNARGAEAQMKGGSKARQARKAAPMFARAASAGVDGSSTLASDEEGLSGVVAGSSSSEQWERGQRQKADELRESS